MRFRQLGYHHNVYILDTPIVYYHYKFGEKE